MFKISIASVLALYASNWKTAWKIATALWICEDEEIIAIDLTSGFSFNNLNVLVALPTVVGALFSTIIRFSSTPLAINHLAISSPSVLDGSEGDVPPPVTTIYALGYLLALFKVTIKRSINSCCISPVVWSNWYPKVTIHKLLSIGKPSGKKSE